MALYNVFFSDLEYNKCMRVETCSLYPMMSMGKMEYTGQKEFCGSDSQVRLCRMEGMQLMETPVGSGKSNSIVNKALLHYSSFSK
jgi:hypothetical protein